MVVFWPEAQADTTWSRQDAQKADKVECYPRCFKKENENWVQQITTQRSVTVGTFHVVLPYIPSNSFF